MNNGIRSHARTKLIAHIRATQPACHLCGLAIPLNVDHQRHPLGSALDELVPRAHGGSPTDPANVAHAHRLCNGIRGTKPITPALRQRCRQAIEQAIGATNGVTRRRW